MNFELIAFDWDGTLADSTGLITRCIQAAAVDLGEPRPSDEDAAYVIGMELHAALLHAVPSLPLQRHAELSLRFRHHYLAQKDEVELFPGTLEMLAALKQRHHWLSVATGKNRRGLTDSVQRAGLVGLFDGSRTADETAGKPSPQMLLELMREFGAEPERTLMIGDTTHDLQMAVNAGCPCVGVSFGAHDHESFAEYRPLFVAHSTAELHGWLLEHA
ncbi:MAG: HAD-IA family hydrolase [Paucibacter sp.]|nr:HAD-IA family hydrolase [Roseateles sp.]